MILAKVVGTVVATRKDERLEGRKLLVCRPVTPSGEPDGNHLVAVDTVGAGFHELVLLVSGWWYAFGRVWDSPREVMLASESGPPRRSVLALDAGRQTLSMTPIAGVTTADEVIRATVGDVD